MIIYIIYSFDTLFNMIYNIKCKFNIIYAVYNAITLLH